MLLNAPGSPKERQHQQDEPSGAVALLSSTVHGNAPIHSSPMPAISVPAAFVIQRA